MMALQKISVAAVIFLVAICNVVLVLSEPAECKHYTVLNSKRRAQGTYNNNNHGCDNQFTGWYRFSGEAGFAMTTSCVPEHHCGTYATGSMQGSHPSFADGVVSRTVCYHYSSNCCYWSDTIRVRNCGSFYVYELGRPPQCYLGYCGNGAASKCPCSNGGTCLIDQSGGRCTCPLGYTGSRCETETSCRFGNPCKNGGTCQDDNNGIFTCNCPIGFTGRKCETVVTTCRFGNLCTNGGTCQDDNNGIFTCNCRVGFTGRKCETGYGTNVTCETNYMEIQMDRNVFGDYDPQDFHLKSKSCRAKLKGNKLSLRTPLDGCGTTHEQTDQTITYWNEVSTYYKGQDGRNGSTVIRARNVHFPFYCKYGRRKTVSTSYSHIGTYFASEGSYGNFTFKMELFRNQSYRNSYRPRDYPVSIGINEPLFVQYSVSSTTADLVVFAEQCRATTTGNPNSAPQYDFIKAGCAVDDTMTYNYQLGRVQRFTIDSFRFVANHPVVYLHCELMVCHRNVSNSRCAQGCQKSKRVRRDAVDGSLLYDLSNGPMKMRGSGHREKESDGKNKLSPLLVGVGATFGGLFFLVTIVLLLFLLRHKRRHNKEGVGNDVTPAHAKVDGIINEGVVTM